MTRKILAVLALTVASSAALAQTDTEKPHSSALKGAAGGAVAGHMMGHHAKTGAVAGAMIGHHMRKKEEQKAGSPG